ncbi:hypothetical protein Tco_1238059 [Tanacetum coccineum]
MVDLVNQRKKYFAEKRARAKRNKPMTQSQLKTYMMNYLKNQGTWKLSQLKNLSFEEVKEEFDKIGETAPEQRLQRDVKMMKQRKLSIQEVLKEGEIPDGKERIVRNRIWDGLDQR